MSARPACLGGLLLAVLIAGPAGAQPLPRKLSEVIARALAQGPQLITKHGEKTVVVISYAEYENLRKSQGKLSEFFHASPLAELELHRDKSLPRKELEL